MGQPTTLMSGGDGTNTLTQLDTGPGIESASIRLYALTARNNVWSRSSGILFMSTENAVSEPGANGSGVPDCEYRISYRATEFPPISGEVHVSRAFSSDLTTSALRSPTRPTFADDDDRSSAVYVTDSGAMILLLTGIHGISFNVSVGVVLPSICIAAAIRNSYFKSINSKSTNHRVEISRINTIAFHDIRICRNNIVPLVQALALTTGEFFDNGLAITCTSSRVDSLRRAGQSDGSDKWIFRVVRINSELSRFTHMVFQNEASRYHASFNAQAKHAGSLESPVEYGIFDATWSLASDVCNLLRPCRRLAEESLADTSPTSVLAGRSCTAHLRIANRKKLHDSCINLYARCFAVHTLSIISFVSSMTTTYHLPFGKVRMSIYDFHNAPPSTKCILFCRCVTVVTGSIAELTYAPSLGNGFVGTSIDLGLRRFRCIARRINRITGISNLVEYAIPFSGLLEQPVTRIYTISGTAAALRLLRPQGVSMNWVRKSDVNVWRFSLAANDT
ncbi:hypothetical protein AGLY_016155, partial [Aphis glycines]